MMVPDARHRLTRWPVTDLHPPCQTRRAGQPSPSTVPKDDPETDRCQRAHVMRKRSAFLDGAAQKEIA
jgi:hypothetical protein